MENEEVKKTLSSTRITIITKIITKKQKNIRKPKKNHKIIILIIIIITSADVVVVEIFIREWNSSYIHSYGWKVKSAFGFNHSKRH